jgi:hypothetical protein
VSMVWHPGLALIRSIAGWAVCARSVRLIDEA